MITISTYLPQHKKALIKIFESNIPLYFAQEELAYFDNFLDKDETHRGEYYVILNDDLIIGCGGIALNEPTKYTNKPHVIMTWGMVDSAHHKKGYGKLLLLHRIKQAKENFLDIKIALGTTQHTVSFFEKYGFKTVAYEKSHWSKDLDLYQMELEN